MAPKLNLDFDSTSHLTILPNNSCDRYCDNTLSHSDVKHKFQCGSLTDSRIWAIYNLNAICPIGFLYIKELEKCISTYKGLPNSCSSPSMNYIYAGNLTWNVFLKIIQKLNLTKSMVSIDFNDDITIDSSWMCSTTSTTHKINANLSNTSPSNSNFSTNYVLHSGCLRISSHSLHSHIIANRLCIANPLNDDLSSNYSVSDQYYEFDFAQNFPKCLPQWLDINTNCYRMLNNRKTIQEARNICVDLSEAEKNRIQQTELRLNVAEDNGNYINKESIPKIMNFTMDFFQGEIAHYTSQWQTRLGFFLLDTNVSYDIPKLRPLEEWYPYIERSASLVSNVGINISSVNEFQMISPNNDNSSNLRDDSCLVLTRSGIDEKQRSSILKNIQLNNCSKPRHTLCQTKTIKGYNSEQYCYRKPLTLDLLTMISNHLTYELCLTVCGEFKTNMVVIHMNKCYCIDAAVSQILDSQKNFGKYRTKDCGNPCPGNTRQLNIGALLDSLNFGRNCIHLNFINHSEIYEFHLNHINDIHPRHCLELCKKYKQQYTLLNSNKCLCTNIVMKKKRYNGIDFPDLNCTQQCPGNYLYTCGNANDSTIYTVYVEQPRCPPDTNYQASEDERRCLYVNLTVKKKYFSDAQSFCKSIGGMLVKIHDTLEIQDTIPKYITSSIHDPTYFWIDRTSDNIDINKGSNHSIEKCFQTLDSIDQNCIIIRREETVVDHTSTFKPCFTESDQCSSMSAIPICVSKHLEFNSITSGDSSIISANTIIDYSCGNDSDFHFMNEYCYKILLHETTWNDAKAECERDNAELFLPGESAILFFLKLLFLRRALINGHIRRLEQFIERRINDYLRIVSAAVVQQQLRVQHHNNNHGYDQYQYRQQRHNNN
ncbi:unnamed protein product [Rotaria sp. Silwood1]|nr:unnamed protein product [Rotaria sp. Silwood1]